MVRSGGKLDRLIFDEGEWWRVLSCNWLHGGLLHFAMNMFALRNLGVPLERCFGSWRVGVLYLLSGIFGTMVSVIFLPEVLSVGASASVFGLIGACWADVALNFCARGSLRGVKGHACSLLLSTLINVLEKPNLSPYTPAPAPAPAPALNPSSSSSTSNSSSTSTSSSPTQLHSPITPAPTPSRSASASRPSSTTSCTWVGCWRALSSAECKKLAPGGDLTLCFPFAEGACCGGCLRRRGH